MHFPDIDECFVGQDNCDDDRASCNNTFGSFSCECNLGYSGDGTIGNCGKLECDRGMCNEGLAHSNPVGLLSLNSEQYDTQIVLHRLSKW